MERRMGERVSPSDLTLLWCPPGTKVGARRGKKQPAVARVVDLSHTGAQVMARADDRVQRGASLDIILRDVPCEVRVRWIRPTSNPEVLAYGIEFMRPPRALTDIITEVFAEVYAREGLELRPQPVARRTAW